MGIYQETSTILEQDLREFLKRNQMGLDQAKQLRSLGKKSDFSYAEMVLGQAEQHLSWTYVYALFFVW